MLTLSWRILLRVENTSILFSLTNLRKHWSAKIIAPVRPVPPLKKYFDLKIQRYKHYGSFWEQILNIITSCYKSFIKLETEYN
jgi:hypothetical protein